MGLKPRFRITANDTSITDDLVTRFVSLRLNDETGFMSDDLEIVLADHDPAARIARPVTGALLRLALGYDNQLTDKGAFVVSGASRGAEKGGVRTLTVRAHAAPYDNTPGGITDFQTQLTRSWSDGITIGAMVKTIAAAHQMQAVVSPFLASVQLPHMDQVEESDISFLVRLGRLYDAIAKPAGGKLLFLARGLSQTASGAALPVINLTESDVSRWNWDEDRREAPGTVVTKYHIPKSAKTHAVSVGSGNPVRLLKRRFRTQAEAKAAAMAEMSRRARGAIRLEIEMPGNAEITAEATLNLDSTFGPDVSGVWLVNNVVHEQGKDGYKTHARAERPNSDPSVSAYLNGTVNDTILVPPVNTNPGAHRVTDGY
ncbi:phage late control D family protein [Asaia astilbis]|uniref:phage late control D family protein n=1 Tax=Asaia astilbis TaxID=610244 RepID=UPI000471F292|nr:contractile injection system protein, VgrG/Pvc8 family [Asaia astilbis]